MDDVHARIKALVLSNTTHLDKGLQQQIVEQTTLHFDVVFAEHVDAEQIDLESEVKLLDRLNYRLKTPVDDEISFSVAVAKCLTKWLTPEYGAEKAQDISDFLVEHCEIDFLETCDDYLDDDDDDDDSDDGSEEDYGKLFLRLASFVSKLVDHFDQGRSSLFMDDGSGDTDSLPDGFHEDSEVQSESTDSEEIGDGNIALDSNDRLPDVKQALNALEQATRRLRKKITRYKKTGTSSANSSSKAHSRREQVCTLCVCVCVCFINTGVRC